MPGLSLLLDLAFPAFPDNMGHWMEALLPVYNILRQGAWNQTMLGGRGAIDTIIFVNLRRKDLAVTSSYSITSACVLLPNPIALYLLNEDKETAWWQSSEASHNEAKPMNRNS